MIRGKIIFLIVVFAFALQGCSLEDDGPNFHYAALGITNAEVPDSFDLGETYRINFTFELPDGCTSYEYPDVTRDPDNATIRNIFAVGAVRTDVEACTQAVTEGSGFFDFNVIYDEPYTFKFFQGENGDGELQYLEVVIPVN